jgi:alpha-beta hydrolase superfamily lysophospholipase
MSAGDAPHDEPPRARPGWLLADGRACLHWWHAPAAARASGWGVVLCPPLGFEHQAMYRALRVLAERAAAHGHVVLRVDYPGTGDSAGGDGGAHDWTGWLAAVRAAADALRAHPAVRAVAVVGVQMGAAIAAAATAGHGKDRAQAEALALVAPVTNGRLWLRERRALLATMGRPDGAAALPDGVQEAAGLLLAADTRARLEQLALADLPGPLPLAVLVADRDDRPPSEAVVRAWEARGAAVTHVRFPGYDLLLRDAHEAEIPEPLWGGVLAWLAALPAPAAGALPTATPAAPAVAADPSPWQLVEPGIEEAPCFLDDEARLFGVISRAACCAPPRGSAQHDTRPGDSAPREAAPRVMLLLNAGANPRVGLGRLHVQLARRLAAHGWTTVRLDLGGLGDSLPHPGMADNTVYPPTAAGDVTTAATWARETLGASHVEAMGVCAGGYHAFKGAVAGAPLTAITVINPLVFFWKPGTSLALPPYRAVQAMADYGRAVRSAAKWTKLLRGQVAVREVADTVLRFAGARLREGVREGARLVGWPLRDDLAQELTRLAGRRVPVRFVFSVGDPGEALLRRGAGRTLGRLARRGALSVTHVPDCDHSFSRAWMREALWSALDARLTGEGGEDADTGVLAAPGGRLAVVGG